MPDLIDTHCHLDDDRFDVDRAEMIARARSSGVRQIVIPATTAERWSKVKQITQQFPDVYAAYGLHPMFMLEHQQSHLNELDSWLDQKKVVAVGECGLDFFQGNQDQQNQLEFYRAQLDIAQNHRLPVIIHARKSLDLILREIRRHTALRGVIHSFSGSLQQAQQLFDLGFKLGIAATISYERANKLRQIVRDIDIDALVIESDAPDQPGQQHRGERNEPTYIWQHLSVMAELRGVEKDTLASKLLTNSQQLFGLKSF